MSEPSALERMEALKKELQQLEKSAAVEIAEKKEAAVRTVAELMVANQVTLLDLEAYLRRISAKYSDGINTWSGKGKKPDWLKRAEAAGVKLESLRVKRAPTQAALALAA